jgi:hypothetical protein
LLLTSFCRLRLDLLLILVDCGIIKPMKIFTIVRSALWAECVVVALFGAQVSSSFAQERIYRCGNEYTNNIKDSKSGSCKLVEGGNVTVVQGNRLPVAEPVRVAALSPKTVSTSGPRVDSADQKVRDSDSRGILESELKKAEAKQADLIKEYNNGEPDRNALEIKNPQRYVDRLAEMKANIARNDSDIAGIKRELGRNQGSAGRAN